MVQLKEEVKQVSYNFPKHITEIYCTLFCWIKYISAYITSWQSVSFHSLRVRAHVKHLSHIKCTIFFISVETIREPNNKH